MVKAFTRIPFKSPSPPSCRLCASLQVKLADALDSFGLEKQTAEELFTHNVTRFSIPNVRTVSEKLMRQSSKDERGSISERQRQQKERLLDSITKGEEELFHESSRHKWDWEIHLYRAICGVFTFCYMPITQAAMGMLIPRGERTTLCIRVCFLSEVAPN